MTEGQLRSEINNLSAQILALRTDLREMERTVEQLDATLLGDRGQLGMAAQVAAVQKDLQALTDKMRERAAKIAEIQSAMSTQQIWLRVSGGAQVVTALIVIIVLFALLLLQGGG